MTELLDTFSRFRNNLSDRPRIYLGGGTGEPQSLSQSLAQRPELAANVTFLGIWIPGINVTSWAGFHPTSKAESIFISPSLRSSFEDGDTALLPISYSQSVHWLATTKIDGAVIMVSPPNTRGMVNLGVSVDFAPTVLARESIPCLGIINPALKPVKDGVEVPLERFSSQVEWVSELPQFPIRSLPASFDKIGRRIASLVNDGDTLQFGLGNVQQSALLSLTNHRNLKIHSGMVSDPLLELLKAGAIAKTSDAIITGVAVGTDTLYDELSRHSNTRFRPASYTHSIHVISCIKSFKSINSALQIDLFGQVNAETLNGKQVSGLGGLTDFHRGSAASLNGRGIIALSSTTSDQKISRIVPLLPESSVTIGRGEADTLVTEHGIANLRGKSLDQRAAEILTIAHPKFRESLANQWHKLRSLM